jgi:hypothetical protein
VTARRTATAAAAVLATIALGASSCGPSLAYACGTPDVPPVALDPARCTAPPSDPIITGGARWWSAPPADVAEPDEQPVVGQVLDGDWWDPTDRNERPDRRASRTASPTPTKATTTRPTPTRSSR